MLRAIGMLRVGLSSLVSVGLLLLSCLASFSASSGVVDVTKYDHWIKQYHTEYVPNMGTWCNLKAQYYQESWLKPNLTSPVGAAGISQQMPFTWSETVKALRWNPRASPYDPELSIEAGAYYMKKMMYIWRAKRPDLDRWQLALASYNAGAGHLIKSQKLAGGSRYYADIAAQLPRVTGHHSKETHTYVRRIGKYLNDLNNAGVCDDYVTN